MGATFGSSTQHVIYFEKKIKICYANKNPDTNKDSQLFPSDISKPPLETHETENNGSIPGSHTNEDNHIVPTNILKTLSNILLSFQYHGSYRQSLRGSGASDFFVENFVMRE